MTDINTYAFGDNERITAQIIKDNEDEEAYWENRQLQAIQWYRNKKKMNSRSCYDIIRQLLRRLCGYPN